jgi:putative oxygen-independent coproporphyrinogen III oxidase
MAVMESRASAAIGNAQRDADTPFGVYVHIPFCEKRCDYCAFAIWTDRFHLHDAYVEAVCVEIGRGVENRQPLATSVFVGGGTPSLLRAESMARILDAIPKVPGAETTIECNPDTVSAELFAVYAAHGVTRISFGVQSMVDHVLVALGRSHNPDNVRQGVAWARAAGLHVNVDLIYGGATETVADWETTVHAVLALRPDHVSAYALTVEPGTPLAVDLDRHPDDDDQADKYDIIDDLLMADGFANYEISNWARTGFQCAHNRLYWRQGNYAGFGCAAHAHRDGRRSWNLRTPNRYINAAMGGESTEASFEILDTQTAALERLQLALRTDEGVPRRVFHDIDYRELHEAGMLIDSTTPSREPWVQLTRAGRMMANAISLKLVVS